MGEGVAGLARSAAVVVDELTVAYGDFEAVRGLTFDVGEGEVFGLLGPNGAGKTSLIRALTTVLKPAAGRATICGHALGDVTAVRRVIGVLPESNGYPRSISALRYLTFFGQLFGATADEARAAAIEQLGKVGLAASADRAIGTYSRGMRQRLGIARALINNPRVLFLDEPTLGLDPAGREDVLAQLVAVTRDAERTVIICSHLLEEIERICDRVAILHHGRLAAIGSIEEVAASTRVATTARIEVPPGQVGAVVDLIGRSPLDCRPTADQSRRGEIVIEFPTPVQSANELAELLVKEKVPIKRIEIRSNRLSDAFLAHTAEARE